MYYIYRHNMYVYIQIMCVYTHRLYKNKLSKSKVDSVKEKFSFLVFLLFNAAQFRYIYIYFTLIVRIFVVRKQY